MQVCVYCASSAKIDSIYFDATSKLAKEFVKHDVAVVFGGGSSGLMGQLADSVLANGGKIKGIMPQFMNEVEWGHKGVSDFVYTQSMHERKAKFLEGTDALVALPGGVGTFEELFEAITLKKLGQFTKPIVVLNTKNYFEPFRKLMRHACDEGFMGVEYMESFELVNEPEVVLPTIIKMANWTKGLLDAGKYRH